MNTADKNHTASIEVEASTVENAIRKAVKALHVNRDDIDVKVLKEEKKGLFGMEGATRAKIRVTVKSSKSSGS